MDLTLRIWSTCEDHWLYYTGLLVLVSCCCVHVRLLFLCPPRLISTDKNQRFLCEFLTVPDASQFDRLACSFGVQIQQECYFALKVWNAQNAGAAAVLVADDREEPLITMDSPEEDKDADEYLAKISIPSALIEKSFGDDMKKALQKGDKVTIKLDWTESMPHPDERVEYELWTNSNDECGARCDDQMDFVRNFKGHAQLLEKGGYTQFTPHYITWYCPEAFVLSKQCKSQCINHGRYCAPDPEQDFSEGYDGKDVVVENLRQLCVHRVANESNKPWVWWDYVTDFHLRCPMKEKKYNKDCAEDVIKSLGLSVDKVKKCMGDPEADAENPVLKTEQDAQVGQGSRGDVTILPTLVINNVQYRGKLERSAILRAICAGFKETTDPPVCLSGDIETNECLTNNGGCWQNVKANITACKDTFRGRVCECPMVSGVQFQGDGYSYCAGFLRSFEYPLDALLFWDGSWCSPMLDLGGNLEVLSFTSRVEAWSLLVTIEHLLIEFFAIASLSFMLHMLSQLGLKHIILLDACNINQKGIWDEHLQFLLFGTYVATFNLFPVSLQLLGQLDAGLKMEVAGQKLKMANHSLHVWNLRSKAVNAPVVLGVTELSVKIKVPNVLVLQPNSSIYWPLLNIGCTCKNRWGGYDCKCKGDLLYITEQDTCIGRNASTFSWFLTLLVLAGLVGAGVAGYVFYKYRLRSYMDSEIMAIMSQYMPLDNQNENLALYLLDLPSVKTEYCKSSITSKY
eukprot:Gb_38951 [translate_table: standard]